MRAATALLAPGILAGQSKLGIIRKTQLARAGRGVGRLALAIFVWLLISFAGAEEFIGVPKVVDGDTLTIGKRKIRLEGIDAPEADQVCLDANASRWICGVEAQRRLASHVAGLTIRCAVDGMDRYGRSLATCWLGANSVNAWMVEQGWALAYVRYSSAYLVSQEKARKRQLGLWAGAFIAPWDWRHRNQQTEIFGALKIPLNAPKLLLPTGTKRPAPACLIKGNVSQNGERIYHQPGQKHYLHIDMNKNNGRRWFCTAEEAEAAGWRKANR